MLTKTRKSLTRIELRQAIYKEFPQLSREQVRKLLDDFFDELTEVLLQDEDVKLRGFGRFKIYHKRPRLGRNPKTGEDAIITARRTLRFAPSPTLIARVNGVIFDGEDRD